ncbi:cytochrome p450 85a1 [Quercus suber]|uniref:Cytochrome p450 85a1 n=1 Tax=Quercus suber TaxID=58331 RepID=A0AAW0MIQ8_QUESU
MGWPLFGETVDFLKYGPDFMKKHSAKYGSVFKSHILGCPTVISMDQELNRYILMNEGKGLVPGYPQSMLDVMGKTNIAAVHGSAPKFIRGSLLSLMAFYVAFRQIIIAECDLIYEAFDKVATAALSLPINIPGRSYYQGLQTRKNIHKIFRQIVEERKASRKTHNDMFAELIGNEKSRYRYETVSVTTMMAIKYLHDHPKALQELKVILETSSLATIVNGLLGKITQDVELNGMFNNLMDKCLESHSYCFLFGAGGGLCPGKELGMVKVSTFLHYYVTKYRWEEVEEVEIIKFPRVEVPNGLHVRIR